MFSMIIDLSLFIIFFQNVDTFLYKDVSTFLSFYRSVSIFFSLSILLFSFRMWMHLYTSMFPHFRHDTEMYSYF